MKRKAMIVLVGMLMAAAASAVYLLTRPSATASDALIFRGHAYHPCIVGISPATADTSAVARPLLGEIGGSKAYAVGDLPPENWIWLENPAMLTEGPVGLYVGDAVKPPVLAEFQPDRVEIVTLPKQMNGDTTSEILDDKRSIELAVAAIGEGKVLSADEKKSLYEGFLYEDGRSYAHESAWRLNFRSGSLKGLTWSFVCARTTDGRFVVLDEASAGLCVETASFLDD